MRRLYVITNRTTEIFEWRRDLRISHGIDFEHPDFYSPYHLYNIRQVLGMRDVLYTAVGRYWELKGYSFIIDQLNISDGEFITTGKIVTDWLNLMNGDTVNSHIMKNLVKIWENHDLCVNR